MPFDNYTDLQSTILEWLGRPADALISGSVPDWIALIEAEANSRLRTHWQELSYTFQTVASVDATTNAITAAGSTVLHFAAVPSGVTVGMTVQDTTSPTVIPSLCTVESFTSTTVTLSAEVVGNGVGDADALIFTQPSYPLPDDFLELRWAKITSLDPVRELRYASPGILDTHWAFTQTDQPAEFTIEGSNLRLGPVPDGTYTIVLDYYQVIPALATAQTNWLLTNYPQIYLFGALMEAFPYLGEDDQGANYQMWSQRREAGFAQLKLMDRKFKTGASPLAMQVGRATWR